MAKRGLSLKNVNHPEELKVYKPDGSGYLLLSERLLDQQRAWDNLEKIKTIHATKLDIFEAIKDETNPKILRSYALDLTECELELQKLWGFPQEIKFHRFWETPKCQCPKLDNEERYPVGYYIINQSCSLHGLSGRDS